MKPSGRILLYVLLIFMACSTENLNGQSDTIQYLFMGHPRFDDRDNEYVLKTVEELDYSKFELLLLGGDLTWNTSEMVSTMEYLDTIFNLSSPNTHLAIGNHDDDNITRLQSYTQKDRYYSFSKNNLTFIVLDTEINSPNISGSQLDLIEAVADTIQSSDYLVLIHHRILWMADNADLEHLIDSVAASSKNLSSSNFFDDVYPELQKVKNKGIPVYCVAGDRTNINIEYSKEDSIQFIASGMVGFYPDTNNYAVVFNHIPQEHFLYYDLVPLSELDAKTNDYTSDVVRMNGRVELAANPCLTEVCPPGVVWSLQSENETFILTKEHDWIWDDNSVMIYDSLFAENENVVIYGQISSHLDWSGDNFYEVEIVDKERRDTSIFKNSSLELVFDFPIFECGIRIFKQAQNYLISKLEYKGTLDTACYSYTPLHDFSDPDTVIFLTGCGFPPNYNSVKIIEYFIHVSEKTSIHSTVYEDFIIYPNPSTGIINLRSNDQVNYDFIVTNLNGQKISQGEFQEELTITLDQGIYILSVRDKTEIMYKQIVIIQE